MVLYAVSSPYSAEALETIARLGGEVAACVRNLPGGWVPDELPAVVEADRLPAGLTELPFIVPLVTPDARITATADARAHGFGQLGSLFDPTATIAATASFGAGCYVNAGAIVAAGVRAGESCLINRGGSIGHHCRLGDFVTIGPGAITGGGCQIEDGAFLGVGTVIAPEVQIGAGATVGAGAVVIENVPDGVTVVGNPARVLP